MATRVAVYDPNKELGYAIGEFVQYEGRLFKCVNNVPPFPGEFNPSYWIELGIIMEGDGYVVSDEGDLEYRDETYVKISGGTFTGINSYNISGSTTNTRTPYRFVAGTSTGGDMTVFQGSNGSIVIGSGNSAINNTTITNSYDVSPTSGKLALVSDTSMKFIVNAKNANEIITALAISELGTITVPSKNTPAQNIPTYIATEAQVYNVARDVVTLSGGGTVSKPIQGVPPTTNADLTRKDYVDNAITTAISNAKSDLNSSIDAVKNGYLKLTGGTLSGALYVPSKTSAIAYKATEYATEAQVYNAVYEVGEIKTYPKALTSAECTARRLLLCNGQVVPTGSTYDALNTFLGGSYGTSNSRSKVPNFQGMFLRGYGSQSLTLSLTGVSYTYTYSSGSIGTAQGMAVPNITGTGSGLSECKNYTSGVYYEWEKQVTGAFYTDKSQNWYGSNGGIDKDDGLICMNANRCHLAYGNASEVRPTNMAVYYYIRY